MRNIILTGFMGTGKTTIGRRLARALGWIFADTDEMIERQAGKTISRIFDEDGEPAFRSLEAQVARDLGRLERHVIATGGGMALAEANLRALEHAGVVALLEASPEAIFARVAHQRHRPLLAKPDPRGEIQNLLEQRREAYGRIEMKIQTEGKRPAAIAYEILRQLNLAGPEPARAKPAELIRVELGERSYPIRIGSGWAELLGEALKPFFPLRPCTLVTNPDIGRLWAGPVLESLDRAGYRVSLCELPEGEEHKTLATVGLIYDHMIPGKHTRQSGIIALGGGVIGDMAGFAAATLLRGIDFVQLPTSLLAMVDSSVGGKTGVNHPLGKNLIGAFWQPAFVGIELKFLETLPDAELRSGMAEVIKYGVIADETLFEYLEEHIEWALERDPEVLGHLVTRSCQIKADVVGRDEREGGLRAILNYGHTFGHAAEALCRYQGLRHGEAVAMGMVAAARLACARGMLGQADAMRIEDLVRRVGLPAQLPRFTPEEYWVQMGSDKKVRDGKIQFVLPEKLGLVRLVQDVSEEEVKRRLEEVMAPSGV